MQLFLEVVLLGYFLPPPFPVSWDRQALPATQGEERGRERAKVESKIDCTANNFGIMYSRKRISQNSFPNFNDIFPKSFMIFCQELIDPKRNYENQI